MQQLTLLRHAKAVSAGDEVDDFARVLAERGRADAPRTAATLARAGADPQIVLVSDAARTRETWSLAQAFFPRAEVRFLHTLYLCPAETLIAEAERCGASRVMLAAHNPGLHELASRMAPRRNPLEAKLRAKFPTAAGAIFSRKTLDVAWKLEAFVTPKDVND